MKPLFTSNTEFKAATAEIAGHLRGTKLGVLREAVANAHGYRTTPAYQASLTDTPEGTTESQSSHPVECYLEDGLLVFRGFLPTDKHTTPMYFSGEANEDRAEWARLASGELAGFYGLKICEPEVVGERLYVTGYYVIEQDVRELYAHDLIAGFFFSQSVLFPQAWIAKVQFALTMKRIEEDEAYCQWLAEAADTLRRGHSRPPEAPIRGQYALSLEQLESHLQAFEARREPHLGRENTDLVQACLPAQELKRLRKKALTAVGTSDYIPDPETVERVCRVQAVEHGFRRIEKRIIDDLKNPVRGLHQYDVEAVRIIIDRDGMLADIVADTVLGKVISQTNR